MSRTVIWTQSQTVNIEILMGGRLTLHCLEQSLECLLHQQHRRIPFTGKAYHLYYIISSHSYQCSVHQWNKLMNLGLRNWSRELKLWVEQAPSMSRKSTWVALSLSTILRSQRELVTSQIERSDDKIHHFRWKALMVYLYTRELDFKAFKSDKKPLPKSGPHSPTMCSPKSMYRLADKVRSSSRNCHVSLLN